MSFTNLLMRPRNFISGPNRSTDPARHRFGRMQFEHKNRETLDFLVVQFGEGNLAGSGCKA
jgi:hypothetical protein